MKRPGEQKIPAPRQAVWAGPNDVEVLRQCIPGCLSALRQADDRMLAMGVAAAPRAFPTIWLLAPLSVTLIGFLISRAQADAGSADWNGLSIGLLVLIVTAAVVEYRRSRAASERVSKGEGT